MPELGGGGSDAGASGDRAIVLEPPLSNTGVININQGSGLPVRFAITNGNNTDVTAQLYIGVQGNLVPAISNGNANDGNSFRPVGNNSFMFNLDTSHIPSGSHILMILLSDGAFREIDIYASINNT